ncbi:hypothetical protein J6590_000109 [Homalodisca vitripennis]|nr:hypothetical protein J6590_000109 [Homalodisca vitripennis]
MLLSTGSYALQTTRTRIFSTSLEWSVTRKGLQTLSALPMILIVEPVTQDCKSMKQLLRRLQNILLNNLEVIEV